MTSPGFDAGEYAEAFKPPTITVGGRTHVGVLLSADEWFAFAPRLEAESASRETTTALIRDLTDLCFPRAWWHFWRPRVSTLLMRLPWGAQLEAVASFMAAQALAQVGRVPGRTPTEATNGTLSVE